MSVPLSWICLVVIIILHPEHWGTGGMGLNRTECRTSAIMGHN
jgi:hypothetical protein